MAPPFYWSGTLPTYEKNTAYLFSSSRRSRRKGRVPRKKLGTKAWIRLAGGFATRPCTIVDLSEEGVQISVEDPDSVPNSFALLMSQDDRTGRRAQVKWRRGSKIGAAFL
jgi:hypothetical protein